MVDALSGQRTAGSDVRTPDAGAREGLPKEGKLSHAEIFEKIGNSLCRVKNDGGTFSATYCGNKIVVTAHHNFIHDLGAKERLNPVQTVYYQAKEYKGIMCHNIKETGEGTVGEKEVLSYWTNVASKVHLVAFGVEEMLAVSDIKMMPDDMKVQVGEKVYFGGYPFNEETPHFFTGRISSIQRNGGISSYTITGAVVSGLSGGLVVFQREKEVYYLGIIIARVSDVEKKFLKMMRAVNTHKSERPEKLGPTINFKDEILDILDVCIGISDMVERNIGTGIGRVIDMKHCRDLFTDGNHLTDSDVGFSGDLPTVNRSRPSRNIDEKGYRFYLHSDEHRDKHICTSAMTMRDFRKNTRNGDATFYPDYISHKNYDRKLEEIIRAFIARKQGNQGALQVAPADDTQYFEMDEPVGCDRGVETKWIQLYYGGAVGSHIRPKNPD